MTQRYGAGTFFLPRLFCGGPQHTALEVNRVIAQYWCAERAYDSACSCPQCILWHSATHPDLLQLDCIGADGKSAMGVEEVRQALRWLDLTPRLAPCRILVLRAIDKLSVLAQQVLLKPLEESTPQQCCLLTALELEPILETIRSRCGIQWVTGAQAPIDHAELLDLHHWLIGSDLQGKLAKNLPAAHTFLEYLGTLALLRTMPEVHCELSQWAKKRSLSFWCEQYFVALEKMHWTKNTHSIQIELFWQAVWLEWRALFPFEPTS